MNYKEALKEICDYFQNKDIKWCLGGSGALLVHGVRVEPNDIDVIVDHKSFDRVYSDFAELSPGGIEEFQDGNRRIRKFQVDLGPIDVEFLRLDLSEDELININWEDLKISVHPLEIELTFYENRPGKEEKVRLIKEKLGENN